MKKKSKKNRRPFPWEQDNGFEIDHKAWKEWAESCGLSLEDIRGIPRIKDGKTLFKLEDKQ